jgi:hypothetical protein
VVFVWPSILFYWKQKRFKNFINSWVCFYNNIYRISRSWKIILRSVHSLEAFAKTMPFLEHKL